METAERIELELRDDLDEDDYKDFLSANMDQFREALDQSANPHDHLSNVDRIEITAVQVYPSYVVIEYQVEYSAYHGCRDVNYVDTDDRDIVAEREGNLLVFEKFRYPERMAPDEEL
jgi:hypothetical protein